MGTVFKTALSYEKCLSVNTPGLNIGKILTERWEKYDVKYTFYF